jgi:hypothetical protein
MALAQQEALVDSTEVRQGKEIGREKDRLLFLLFQVINTCNKTSLPTPQNEQKFIKSLKNHYMRVNSSPTASQKILKNLLSK